MKFCLFPAAALLFAGLVLPAMADERSVSGIFEAACLTPDHDHGVMSAIAGTIDALAEADPSMLGIVPPLMAVETVARWDSSDSKSRSTGPILLVGAEGKAMAQAAAGCLVMGQDDGGKILTVLDQFETALRIDADPGSIGPPYRYWLVDGVTGPAIFAAAIMPNPKEGEDGLALALVRVAPDVMEQLKDGL